MNVLNEYDLGNLPRNLEINKSFLVTNAKFLSYDNIVCSVSGGSDSDIMIDLFCRINKDKVTFVFFDTGLEYNATKKHIKYLEEKYDIKIITIKAEKPIPITCRDYGQPFISKQISEFIQRLQKFNFKFEDETFEVLLNKYCIKASSELEDYLNLERKKSCENKNYKGKYKKYSYTRYGWFKGCVASLRWWCNEWGPDSRFNISYKNGLKEFMHLNPPCFKISPKCCKYAKKDPIHKFINSNDFDLDCYGVRKSEKGARSSAYKNCFTDNSVKGKVDEYRPLFWYKDDTKKAYEEFFNITHSDCYTVYGLKRTGCVGCPYNKKFESELEIIKKYEPNLYIAVNNIFKDSYQYTRDYLLFKELFTSF